MPTLANPLNSTVVTSVGQTVYLYCGVSNLGDRQVGCPSFLPDPSNDVWQVSWIRSRDLTILTIGLIRYTRDQRFTAIHGQDTNNWALKVDYQNISCSL